MRTLSLLSLAVLGSGLAAQSNVVPGLDGRLTSVNNLTYWGRRGPAHPNGEVGMSMLNRMCNPGSVNIPWAAAMQENHPWFGFIIARVANDRIEQINEWSFCKHAWLSVNVDGDCGTCNDPAGSFMGLNCSDTYGAGTNANRDDLGPPWEIDPWLGIWNAVGSYFDLGDPSQPGYPLPADGNDSLDNSIFLGDEVWNRVTVDEADLLTAGAQYYYGIQLVHNGEAVANRWDNLAHRGFNPSWSGTSWSFANDEGQEYGSILDRWPGASVDSGQNGNADGRFFVAVKVTPLGGGNYHYEYAIHNVDNSRAGAMLRVPVEAAATVSNYTFGDIDTDAGNDWSATRVGNEIRFTAPAGNPLEWNTIYNFGFDCDVAPGLNSVIIDEARPGPGANQVLVPSQAPSGVSVAITSLIGEGCGGTTVDCDEAVYQNGVFDLANSSFLLDYDSADNSYTLTSGGSWIAPVGPQLSLTDDSQTTVNLPFQLDHPGGATTVLNVCSNGFVSDGSNGTAYDPSVSSFVGGNPRWSLLWRDLNPAGSGSGPVRVDSTAARVVVSWDNVNFFSPSSSKVEAQLQFWANGDVCFCYQAVAGTSALVGYSRGSAADPGQVDISASLGAGLAVCDATGTPNLALTSTTRPIIGTTVSLDTSNGPASAVAGLSIFGFTQLAIDVGFLGLPECTLFTTLDAIDVFFLTGGSGSRLFDIPNDPALAGVFLVNQAVVPHPGFNPFGAILSNGVVLTIGIN